MLLSCIPNHSFSQNPEATDFKNININSITDKQIQTILEQASSQGLTIDQAVIVAKSKGATQMQIDQFLLKVNQSKKNTASGKTSEIKLYSNALYDYAETHTKKSNFILSEKLKLIFGHQLFNSKDLSFEPSVNIAISKDYVLGVNDELLINISGASQQTYQLKIDRNGFIHIPSVGQISLLGLEFEEARSIIKRRLSAFFRGMIGSAPNTWADVTLSSLRSIKVNVIGEALTPGTYVLPASATAFNALYLSGGPNENGSFRNIEVRRDGKLIKIIDVYDYLLNSNTSSNASLRDQDVIYIPTYEKRVFAAGEFKRSGYYELKKGETIDNLITYSGGFTSDAYEAYISVARKNGIQRSLINVKASEYAFFIPESGDSITSGKILNRFENRVQINGAVFRPGEYALTPKMKLSKLIANAEGLREDAFTNRGLIFRLGEGLIRTNIAFIPTDVISGKNDIDLQREDSVVIMDISSQQEHRFVRILGEVSKPGKYEYNENMGIGDLIYISGGLKETASESYVEISRRRDYQMSSIESPELVQLFQLKISRDNHLSDEDKRFLLKPFDYIYVRRAPSYSEQKTVNIEGEVLYPGPYSIQSKTDRVSDLLKRSGGLTKFAYLEGAILYRNNLDQVSSDTSIISYLLADSLQKKITNQLHNGRVELRLDKILQNPKSIYNYLLKEGDRIYIPEMSEEVRVAGSILNPVGLVFENGKNAKYYIDRAGGFNDSANKSKVYVIYSNGTSKVTTSFLGNKYPKVLPGSKIIVPEKKAKEKSNLAQWLSIASTFSSLAVAIAAVLR